MSDEKLYELCKRWGALALKARQRFAGLLPEVFRRKLFLKKGLASIHEFAAKLAGLSHEQVNTILCLDRRFEDKPVLKSALEKGEISVNKLARVASIATVENQDEIFAAGKNLSKAALEVFVKDYKSGYRDGLCEPSKRTQVLPGQEILAVLSPEVKRKIKELLDKGHDINALLLQFFAQREEQIQEEKVKLAEAQMQEQSDKEVIGMPVSRYISAKIRKIVYAEHGSKCSIPGCKRESKVLHHSARFAIARVHDPRFLAPLCAEHHELVHAVDVRAGKWRRVT